MYQMISHTEHPTTSSSACAGNSHVADKMGPARVRHVIRNLLYWQINKIIVVDVAHQLDHLVHWVWIHHCRAGPLHINNVLYFLITPNNICIDGWVMHVIVQIVLIHRQMTKQRYASIIVQICRLKNTVNRHAEVLRKWKSSNIPDKL